MSAWLQGDTRVSVVTPQFGPAQSGRYSVYYHLPLLPRSFSVVLLILPCLPSTACTYHHPKAWH